MATIDHDARPSLGRKQGLDFSSAAVFVCHTNEELMMKMKTMTLRIGGRSTLETSIRRWGFGSVRRGFFTFGLRIRFWIGFGEWFLFFHPESCLSRSGVRGWAEGSIVWARGSGIVIYRYPRPVVGLGHVTRTAGTMDTCAQWALGLVLGLSGFVRPSMCAMSND